MAAAFLGIASLPVLGLGLYLRSLVRHSTHAQIEEGLLRSAALVADEAADAFRAGQDAVSQALARRQGQALQARVTLIARDGLVVGDSEHDPRTMDNHGHRPEVRQALAEGVGADTRHSETLDLDMLYVAARVGPAREPLGTARVALPLSQVEQASRHAGAAVGTAVVIAMGVALLLSVWLSARVTGPLRELSEAAAAVAVGDLDTRVRPRSQDELGQVATTFNHMVSQLRLTVQGLQEEKRRVETILAQMADGIIVVGADDRVIVCNAAAGDIFGIAPQTAVGRTLAEATIHYELDEMFQRARDDAAPVRMDIRTTQPREAALDAVVTPIYGSDGELQAAVCVLHDMTELRRLESIRRDLVANVSHELRTPLATIRAKADVLLDSAKDDVEARERFLSNIAAECARLSTLLDDLLALARIESGKWEPRPQPVALRDVAERVVAKLEPAIKSKALEVRVDVRRDVEARADPDALERIVLNLLDNAVRYTPEGGRVSIEATATGREVCLDVADTGVGIPEADLPRVFERFYRVDRTRSRQLGGTGLGLSIVRHLVEAHGGTVAAESASGQGSRFSVRLPVASAPET